MRCAVTAISILFKSRHYGPGTKRALRRGGFVLVNVLFVLTALFPFYWILTTSVKTTNELNAGTTGIFPAHLTGVAYKQIFTESGLNFVRPVANSVIVALSTTVVTVLLGTLASYALARLDIPGKGAILTFVLLVGFFPILAVVGPLFLVYRHTGLLNSHPGLVLAYGYGRRRVTAAGPYGGL
ncbi:MAG: carbohydrate ABC transporter permease [Acidimicrobiales bacterium]